MARLNIPAQHQAPADSQPVLDAVSQQMGFVPNVLRLLSNSPTALQGFLGLMGTLSKTLDVRTREAIAMSVSQANGCDYCMALHSFVSNTVTKTSEEEIALNFEGKSSDPKRAAAATFGKRLIETRGKVSDEDLALLRREGFADAQIVEIVALTAQVLLTNFMNNVAQTESEVPALKAAMAG